MVGEDEVFTWFRALSGHKRIDVMCSLLNKCLPFELRFFGTCLEHLGKQYFNQMKDVEVKANNPMELSDLLVNCILSDTQSRQKLALYICLVHSLNTTCSNSLYKTLISLDLNQIMSLAKHCDEKDENKNLLDELLLIYTVAVNHPAFSFEQQANLGNILLNMRREEENLRRAKQAEATFSTLTITSDCSPSTTVTCSDLPLQTVPPGLSYPQGMGTSGNYISIPSYPPFHLQHLSPHPSIVWQMGVVNLPSMAAEPVPDVAPATPYPPVTSPSPSPSQSSSPSRSTSPSRKVYHHHHHQHQHRTAYGLGQAGQPNPNKRMYDITNMKTEEETRGLSERKLLTEELQHKLRTAVVSMNGIVDTDHDLSRHKAQHSAPPATVSATAGFETEGPFMPGLPRSLDPVVLTNQHPSISALNCCNSIVTLGPRFSHPPPYCPHTLQALNMDNDGSRHCSSSSSSDASSTSHSPPATPATLNQNWERGPPGASGLLGTGCELPQDDGGGLAPKLDRPRQGLSRGRSRLSNPTGVQTLPRGRGPHSTLVLDGTMKTLAGGSRREGPLSAPPTPHEEKKVYGEAAVAPPIQQSPVTSAMTPSSGVGAVPYANPPPNPPTFLTNHFTAPPMFPYQSTFVRPSFPFPNGEIMFPYQPQPPFVQPVVTYSATVPPPKVSCYNCSSQTHHATDCKEPTMEEYSSKGQYRIDYKPYPKPGDCFTEK